MKTTSSIRNPKKIGIVGGVTWRSTVDYYAGICLRSEHRELDLDPHVTPAMPEISIESLDHGKVLSYLGSDNDENSWRQFDDYHRAALQRLEASGADFAVLASNSPHHRLEAITRGITLPVISILDAVGAVAARLGAAEVLILGTAITMRSARFREGFARYKVSATGPADESDRAGTLALVSELQRGEVQDSAERLTKIASTALHHFRTQPAVCLACTELPLAFPSQRMLATFEHNGIHYINSTAAHIEAIVDFAFSPEC
jgi:aspartate racemase